MLNEDRLSGTFELVCDEVGCGHTELFKTNDWHKMLAEAKELGWEIKKSSEVWEHFCPTCMEG